MSSSVYDLLGFLAPFTLSAKLILQELYRKKIGCDEKVEGQALSDWKDWLAALPKLSEVAVRRCYKPDSFGEVSHAQVHHFSDASQCAYGVASYLRMIDTDGNIHCSFVIGKSRLAPLKAITIPRLELSAAVVSVKLDNMIRRELDLPIEESIFWSDSTSVIQLIPNQSKRFQTFVANRLSIIHHGSSPDQWRYVDSRSNPADDASRGLTAEQLIRNKRWLHGPEFLWKSDECWPSLGTIPNIPDDHPEVKHEVQTYVISHKSIMNSFIERYSSWNRLKRGVAWLLKYKLFLLSKVRHHDEGNHLGPIKGELSVDDLKRAEKEIVVCVQREAFKEHFSQVVKSKSPLRKLCPILIDGILCVGGRLQNAPIPTEVKHPVLLPKKHHITDLIVRKYHEELAHAGREHVLSFHKTEILDSQGSCGGAPCVKRMPFLP